MAIRAWFGGTPLIAAWLGRTSPQVSTGESRTIPRIRSLTSAPVGGLQGDRPAHRPPGEDDVAGAVVERPVHCGGDVLPFGVAEVAHPVRQGGRAHVVAVGRHEHRHARGVERRRYRRDSSG